MIRTTIISLILGAGLFACGLLAVPAFSQTMSNTNRVSVRHIQRDFSVTDLANESWKLAEPVSVSTYWNGDEAPASRSFSARLLWTSSFLYVLFEAAQSEPLVVADNPILSAKTMNLWDRDVCEIFLAPDKNEPRKYFEFEIAPTGEWIDVGLVITNGRRVSNWNYRSGMESTAKIEKGKIVSAIKVPWSAFSKSPKIGDIWLGNLFRCVGKDPDRGYLAWRPTLTEEPSFHVPDKFGEFVFLR
jgi:hypothetical protein